MIRSKTLLAIVMTVLISLLGLTTYEIAAQDETETISGTVTAVDWDEDGNTVTVAISVTVGAEDPEEEPLQIDYYVADTKKGNELLKLVDKFVRATGRVEEDSEGNKTIYVADYEVIDEDEG